MFLLDKHRQQRVIQVMKPNKTQDLYVSDWFSQNTEKGEKGEGGRLLLETTWKPPFQLVLSLTKYTFWFFSSPGD